MTYDERRRVLANTLANMSNALWRLQHKHESWDTKIQVMQEIGKLVPLVVRCLIFMKNTEGK